MLSTATLLSPFSFTLLFLVMHERAAYHRSIACSIGSLNNLGVFFVSYYHSYFHFRKLVSSSNQALNSSLLSHNIV